MNGSGNGVATEEVIAVTAGEAEDPERSIPRAMRTMVLRLIIFYILAVAVMLWRMYQIWTVQLG